MVQKLLLDQINKVFDELMFLIFSYFVLVLSIDITTGCQFLLKEKVLDILFYLYSSVSR